MDPVIIFCAKYLLFMVLLGALIFWLSRSSEEKVRMVLYALIISIVAVILAKIGGSLFLNARPFIVDHVTPLVAHGNDNGFPSDHTLAASVVAVTLFLMSKRVGIAFFAFALVIGFSRVLAHVHHPVDIMGSIVFAVIGGVIAYYLTPQIMKRIRKEHQVPEDTTGA